MKYYPYVFMCIMLFGCCGQYNMPSGFIYTPVQQGKHTLATWQKITNKNSLVHIYIEGDGRAFYMDGQPTHNPTPKNSLVQKLAANDSHDNVVYIARPCQFIMDSNCDVSVWTNARFSQNNIDSVAGAIKQIAKNSPIVLVGYSGGAMVTGLIINQNHDIKVKKWITVAGVLNHHDWTNYFSDTDLDKSLDLYKLPNVHQIHYIAENDSVVPMELSLKWINPNKIKIIPNATHDNFNQLEIDFE